MIDTIKPKQTGYTLIEIMLSLTIFSVVIVAASALFQMVIAGQRSNLASQNLEASIRYAMEVMSKELRNAKGPIDGSGIDCGGGSPQDDYNLYSELNSGNNVQANGIRQNGVGLAFRNKKDLCVSYRLIDGRIVITRGLTALPITPADIQISNLHFIVDDDSGANNNFFQPSVTMSFHAVTNEGRYRQEMDVQTTISSRYYGDL